MNDLVLGLGNPLMADDGLGLTVLERLGSTWRIPSEVALVDGGTWGMNLLPLVEDTERLILIDAIDNNAPVGTLMRLEREALPRYFSLKLSPHQVDLREVLALAELRGTLPREIVAIGLQPGRVEMHAGLSPALMARVDEVVLAVVTTLERWGHACVCMTEPAHA